VCSFACAATSPHAQMCVWHNITRAIKGGRVAEIILLESRKSIVTPYLWVLVLGKFQGMHNMPL